MFKNPAMDTWPMIGKDKIDICGICLDGLNYSKAIVGPCLHSFHVHCIEEWRQVRERRLLATCVERPSYNMKFEEIVMILAIQI